MRKRRIEAWLRDPDESARRRARRASVFARWVETLEPMPARMGPMRALGLERWVETLEVAPAQMRSIAYTARNNLSRPKCGDRVDLAGEIAHTEIAECARALHAHASAGANQAPGY